MTDGTIFILGGDGFVGSAYVRLFKSLGLPFQVITRQNYQEMKGRRCAVFINANGNSSKPAAVRDPVWDFDTSTRSVVHSLSDFPADRYVMLSSGSVYPQTTSPDLTREDQRIDLSRLSRYGLHKILAEQAVQGIHKSWIVMRMGNFIGPGLKKNSIYDIVTGSQVWLAPQSELQFINTDDAAKIVWALIGKGVQQEIINLGGQGVVRLSDVYAYAKSASQFSPSAAQHRFELSLDKLRGLSGAELPRSCESVFAFVDVVRRRGGIPGGEA